MKYFTIFTGLVVLSIALFSQTYTSVSNGNWTSPTTWNPIGVPISDNTVTINHDVILNTDFNTSGIITVNTGGSLIGDILGRSFAVIGGELYIDGTMDVTNFDLLSGNTEVSGNFH